MNPTEKVVICGMSKKCKVVECVHKKPHQHSDGCKGLCKHEGYPDCLDFRPRERK
jgi:hypothetical protein